MGCRPPGESVAKVAAPPAVEGAGAEVVAPSLKVTVPVGVPEPGAFALTVAVNVTDWPNTDGLTEVAVVVVAVLADRLGEVRRGAGR